MGVSELIPIFPYHSVIIYVAKLWNESKILSWQFTDSN